MLRPPGAQIEFRLEDQLSSCLPMKIWVLPSNSLTLNNTITLKNLPWTEHCTYSLQKEAASSFLQWEEVKTSGQADIIKPDWKKICTFEMFILFGWHHANTAVNCWYYQYKNLLGALFDSKMAACARGREAADSKGTTAEDMKVTGDPRVPQSYWLFNEVSQWSSSIHVMFWGLLIIGEHITIDNNEKASYDPVLWSC